MGVKEVGKDTRMTLKCGALDLTGERESRTLKILSLFKKNLRLVWSRNMDNINKYLSFQFILRILQPIL